MWEKLERIYQRSLEIDTAMASPEVLSDMKKLQALGQEKAANEGLVNQYIEYRKTRHALDETRAMLKDNLDEAMLALAKDEIARLENFLVRLGDEVKQALMPRDINAEKDVIMEIRAGAGGEEASLFASALFRMYSRYAQAKGWTMDIINMNGSEAGGFKEVVFEVKGRGAYGRLKYESGVHRVQRVPATESSGRIHTSTATVAVLPEVDEVAININSDDLRIDIFHSGGAGGQNVNKVATAVRITHLPTGIVAICQDERSQLRNRQKAMAVLRARLFDIEQTKKNEEIASQRRSQVGTGDRAEKIRTYNFPQDRLTDHRISLTVHNLPRIMEGELDAVVNALATEDQARMLDAELT
jgi:peptide chain release factor 1